MRNDIFEDALKFWHESDGHSAFWNDLAEKWDYSDGERMRQEFKRERKRRGISKESEKMKHNGSTLVFDIETSPMEVYTFGLWDQTIGVEQIVNHPFVICWSAKNLNSAKIQRGILTSKEAKERDDSRIVKEIWELINSNEILIGQNIKEFDLKFLNTRFLFYGIPPLKSYKIVDTLQTARTNFSFPSNSLKYINKFLGIKQKKENAGFSLWKNCMDGKESALKEMSEYCDGDVQAVEDLYYRLRPFMKNHPNLGLYYEISESVCPNCGGIALEEEGFYYTPSGKYQSLRCSTCGAVSREKQNLLPKTKRKKLLV